MLGSLQRSTRPLAVRRGRKGKEGGEKGEGREMDPRNFENTSTPMQSTHSHYHTVDYFPWQLHL